MNRERRRAVRVRLDIPVLVSWTDSYGTQHHARGRCLNASEIGLRLELAEPINTGAYVIVQAERQKLHTSATVRDVITKGFKYRVGIEFSSTWKWKDLARLLATGDAARNE